MEAESGRRDLASMNILQLISSGGFYGAERMVVGLSRALADIGCHVGLGVFRNEPNPHLEIAERARECGLRVYEIECHGRGDRGAVRRIRGLVAETGADVVHSHGYKPNLYARAALGLRGPKLVSTCHLYTDANRTMRFYGWLDRLFLRRYDAVSAVSERERDRLLAAGVPAAKVRVINNGIDCAAFSGALPVLRRSEGGMVVGFIGRLAAQKNPTGFLAAAREAIRVFPRTRFILVGDGPDRTGLESLRREWGLDDHVEFLGFRPDMPEIYASLDLFVLPSIAEGLPMAILECMAAGKPVIATRVGAVEKLVRDGETGLLLDPGDQQSLNRAVLRLLRDREEAVRLGCAGQRLVRERFSTLAMARSYLELYRLAGARG